MSDPATAAQKAVSFLQVTAAQLQDYRRPGCCPPCLLLASRTMFNDRRVLIACLQPECHRFWDAVIAVLTAQRSAQDTVILRNQLHRNICRCPFKAKYRDHAFEWCTQPDVTLVQALYTSLQLCFMPNLGKRSQLFDFAHPKKSFGSTRGLWPLTGNDLTPFGARQSLEMYLHWCCTLEVPFAISCLASFILGCRTTFFPFLLESPNRERFLWLLVQMLNADRAPDNFAWPATVSHPHYGLVPSWFTAEMKHTSLWSAGELISALTNGPDAHPRDVATLWDGFERALLPALNTALDLIASNPAQNYVDEESQDALCHWVVRLQRVCTDIPLHPLAQHLRDEVHPKILQGHLTHLYQRRACWGPGCNVVAADIGHSLQVCARCKFTQYCSKACQRADWNSDSAPHNSVCPLLRPMVAAQQEGDMPWRAVWSVDRHGTREGQYDLIRWLNFTLHLRYQSGDLEVLSRTVASQHVG